MLQQTTVKAVEGYWRKFVARWPSVHDLAAAQSEDVMREWAGLGYYARARNLHACAKTIVREHGGRFPRTAAALRELPGIGDYTAAAVAAIAFGERAAVVDGNIERVSLRQLADATPLPKAKRIARSWMDEHTPADRPGDFVQATMDLGATVCTPRSPACVLCPVREPCRAAELSRQTDFPVKAAKRAKPARRGAAFVAMREDRFWTVTRATEGMLGGMAAVPSTDWSSKGDGATEAGAAPFAGAWRHAGRAEHGFTHFDLTLDVYLAVDAVPEGPGRWSDDRSALPSLFRKVVDLAFESEGSGRILEQRGR